LCKEHLYVEALGEEEPARQSSTKIVKEHLGEEIIVEEEARSTRVRSCLWEKTIL
jgi:hypothetical protein